MKEHIISFDTAKLAKEKGFLLHKGEFKMYRDKDGHLFNNCGPAYDILAYCSHAPTQSLLQKWIRERFNIHIDVKAGEQEGKLKYFVDMKVLNKFRIENDLSDEDFILRREKEIFNYEEALELGLQKALKFISKSAL